MVSRLISSRLDRLRQMETEFTEKLNNLTERLLRKEVQISDLAAVSPPPHPHT